MADYQRVDIRLEDGAEVQIGIDTSKVSLDNLPIDIKSAWAQANQSARGADTPEGRAVSIGSQCRCALVSSSITSLVDEVEPAQMAAWLYQGDWTPEQAISFAKRISQEHRRAEALIALAPHLPQDMRPQLVAIIDEMRIWPQNQALPLLPTTHSTEIQRINKIGYEYNLRSARIGALARLLPYLSIQDQDEVLQVIFGAVFSEDYTRDRITVLENVVPQLSDVQIRKALEQALGLPTSLAHKLPQRVIALDDRDPRGEAYLALLPGLTQRGHCKEAFELALTIRRPEVAARTLMGIAAQPMTAEERIEILKKARERAQEIRYQNDRPKQKLLKEIETRLARTNQPVTSSTALSNTGTSVPKQEPFHQPRLDDQAVQAETLASLAMQTTDDEYKRIISAYAIEVLHQYVSVRDADWLDLEEVFSITNTILNGLSEYISDSKRREFLDEIVSKLAEFEYEYESVQLWALGDLMPYLDETQQHRASQIALSTIRKTQSEGYFDIDVFMPLASYISELEWPELPIEERERVRDYIQSKASETEVSEHHQRLTREEEPSKNSVLSELADALEIEAGSYGWRAEALQNLSHTLSEFPSERRYSIWEETLPKLSLKRSRADLLSALRALAPFIHSLDGDQALLELANAVRDVTCLIP